MSDTTVIVGGNTTQVTVSGSAVTVAVSETTNEVTVTQTPTPSVQVSTAGPQGATGPAAPTAAALSLSIDGGGFAITTGVKNDLVVPFNMTITGWYIVADPSGSIVIDVWKDTYGNFPPTVADSITGSEKPTVSNSNKASDTSLSTWTTSVTAGDTLRFNVESCTTIQRATLVLQGNKV